MKVEILDGIMGSGKSTSICKWMDDVFTRDASERFFYVSPLILSMLPLLPLRCGFHYII